MKRYAIASVLALSLAGFVTPVQAQDDRDDLNQLLASLQEARAKMYAMAQHDKSMMPGVKRLDQMITMVKNHKAAPKRRAH